MKGNYQKNPRPFQAGFDTIGVTTEVTGNIQKHKAKTFIVSKSSGIQDSGIAEKYAYKIGKILGGNFGTLTTYEELLSSLEVFESDVSEINEYSRCDFAFDFKEDINQIKITAKNGIRNAHTSN